MDDLRKQPVPVLLCSGGDFYGTADVFSEPKSHFVARMMAEMGYDAVGIGEMDLNFGLAALVGDARDYDLPIVCANLTTKVDSLRVRTGGAASAAADRMGTAFPPYVIVERAGARFGFLGVVSPATKVATAGGAEAKRVAGITYTLEDPVAAAADIAPELRSACDVMIVVAHMSTTEAENLVEQVPGVDLVILGHGSSVIGDPVEAGGARLVCATSQGQYIGEMSLYLTPQHALGEVRNRIHALVGTYRDDPAMASKVDEFDEKNRALQKELYAKQQFESASDESQANRYVGVGACQTCHADAFDVYMTTRHAHAFQTLAEQFVHRDSNCVGCHVTGYGEVGGYSGMRRRGSLVDLVDVQCEACHGPGSEHSRDGDYAARAVDSCVKCHTKEDDPDFDFDTYWPKIAH